MVARPPLRLGIAPMTIADIPEILEIDRVSLMPRWPDDAYRNELSNRLASYLVARAGERLVGFGGIWLMLDEAHVTTFAVHPSWRRRGIGERILLALLDVAIARHAREATLEVRLSNVPARRLYEKFGFRPVGLRPRYYSDDGEDALIMTTDPLDSPSMRERLAGLRAAIGSDALLDEGPDQTGDEPGTGSSRGGAA